MAKPIALASDHAGYPLKEHLKAVLQKLGVPFEDLGTNSADSVDYPDYAHKVVQAMESGRAERGLLVCGSGQGMAMAANRHHGIRAAVVVNEDMARLSREHNDANVLTLGGRLVDNDRAEKILKVWLETPFAGGRHTPRVEKIEQK
jgi:ribose 5-phosphate isomerase B